MGLIINRRTDEITFPDLLDQLDIADGPALSTAESIDEVAVHLGGPVETARGFVLHTKDYFVSDSTLNIKNEICLTATIDVLKAMAHGSGPDQAILTLGYAGWSPGQLEKEILANGWLNCPADAELVFSEDLDAKYDLALSRLGIDPSFLVMEAGHG